MAYNLKTLDQTKIPVIVNCLHRAFQNYFVPITKEISFWRTRWITDRVNFSRSVGVFDGGDLVGFIIQGIDIFQGFNSAYNAGTGILPEYRGQGLVDLMYDFIFNLSEEQNTQVYTLEVIQENHRAIKAYQRVGFEIDNELLFFHGTPKRSQLPLTLEATDLMPSLSNNFNELDLYPWGYHDNAIQKKPKLFNAFLIRLKDNVLGHCIMNNTNDTVIQVHITPGNEYLCISALNNLKNEIKFANIDARRRPLVDALIAHDLRAPLSQFQMSLKSNN